MAKNLEFAINHNQLTGTTEISWENIRGKQSSSNIGRTHRTLESKKSTIDEPATKSGGNHVEGRITDGKDTGKPKSVTPKLMSNTRGVKETKGDSAINPEKNEAQFTNIDRSCRIMDGSDEVN